MPLYRAQAIIPYFSGDPKDVIVNTFHFVNETDTFADVAGFIKSRLDTFYLEVYNSGNVDRVTYVDWPGASYKVFDLSQPSPRVPEVRSGPWTTVGTNASSVPTEVACVVSFHAAPESGVRFQRLYNRIFLGAIPQTAMLAGGSSNYPRFLPAFTDRCKSAASFMRASDTVDTKWVQVSNAGGTTVSREIAGGWVDNSPDTQRRRSVNATLRNTWVAA